MSFTKIEQVDLPKIAKAGEGFKVIIEADGEIPFAQLIVRHADGWEWIVKEQRVTAIGKRRYQFDVPAEAYHAGTAYLQIEGCRVVDLTQSNADDWISIHQELEVQERNGYQPETPKKIPVPTVSLKRSTKPVIYFAIHKCMHQPYNNITDTDYWDGEKDEIFVQRGGSYTGLIPTAVWQYINSGLGHAGLSTSWSGSLIEQLHRCHETGRGHGAFHNWSHELCQIAQEKTVFGHARVDFSAFGYFHPLMPLIPERDIIGQIKWHREIIKETFGVEASDVMFPPETAFQPHMIPALRQAGVTAVMYDSIHHFRAVKGYQYAGPSEGMLPPNRADQVNPKVDDWMQLNNIYAPSKISPSLLKPCLLVYTDHNGEEHNIIGVPAERYMGNEDARGVLQYEGVMGQIYDQLVKTDGYDPDHPPFFILHSDGDNYGEADSYDHNTSGLVQMCQNDPRFQLITVKDYLHQFPVDPENRVHLEPGSWGGADNGDPQFTKWFSWAEKDYSPDLNSWAVLTALQNVVYSLEDFGVDKALVHKLKRLLYMAETSCYWTGQDTQVTNATNKGLKMAQQSLKKLIISKRDNTGPTIFMPWVRPANPGGKDWQGNGQDNLKNAAKEATFFTFVHDISGVKSVTLYYYKQGHKRRKKAIMENLDIYPSRTNPAVIARQYKTILPAGTGNIRYYIEAIDKRGNVSHSPVGRIYIA